MRQRRKTGAGRDGRMSSNKLVAAVSWLSLGNFMVRALSLVTMPLLTRYLSPQAYGEAALVGTAVSLASVFALAGLDMGYARHVFSGRLGDSMKIEAFCWRWTIASACLLALLVGIAWWALAGRLDLPKSLTGFVAVGVLASPLMSMSQMRARLENRYARLSWVQFATGCAGAAVSIGIAIAWRQDAWALLVAMVVGYAMPVALLGAPPWRRLAAPSGLGRLQRRRLLATGLAGIVTAPAYWVLANSDRWFLTAYHDSSTVGIYSIGYTVGTIGTVLSMAITSAWLPELSRAESADGAVFAQSKAAMIQLLAALLLIVAVAVAAAGGDVIRWIADPRFHPAVVVVPWLAAGVLFYGCLHIGSSLLVLVRKLHWAALAWVAALLASLALNAWLVPAHGMLGAALVQAASFLLVMALVWAAVLRFDSLRLQWMRLAVGFVVAIAAGVAMQAPWVEVPWLSLVLKMPVGLLFAVACMWVVAPGMLGAGWRRIKGAV